MKSTAWRNPLLKTTPGQGDQTSRIPRVSLDHPGDAWSWMSTGSMDVGVAGTAMCLSPRQRGVPPSWSPRSARGAGSPPSPGCQQEQRERDRPRTKTSLRSCPGTCAPQGGPWAVYPPKGTGGPSCVAVQVQGKPRHRREAAALDGGSPRGSGGGGRAAPGRAKAKLSQGGGDMGTQGQSPR